MTTLPAGASLAEFIADRKRAGKRVFTTSRSAAITHQRCPRRRYKGYHEGGSGITKVRLSVPLATGGYTHVALAELLNGMSAEDATFIAKEKYLQEYYARGLDLELGEDSKRTADEQMTIVEAFTHLAARRVIPSLLEEYEIEDVEREEWFVLYEDVRLCIVMETRCDGLLRERGARTPYDPGNSADVAEYSFVGGDLYVLSWKTAASWDKRKAREAKTDMQGLSEAYAVELRVGEPVMGAKMVHLLKGKREQYPEDSGKWIQKSPLIYAWMNGGGPTPQFAWTFAWDDPELVNDWGRAVKHKLGKGWRRVFIPDVMPVAEWIQMLDEGQIQPEAGDCLAKQFISPMPEPRSIEQKEHWLRQMEDQEVQIAESLNLIEMSGGVNIEALLDSYFPQFTHSCNYPGQCAFWELCWGGEEVDNPTTLYQIRQPHHPGESMVSEES